MALLGGYHQLCRGSTPIERCRSRTCGSTMDGGRGFAVDGEDLAGCSSEDEAAAGESLQGYGDGVGVMARRPRIGGAQSEVVQAGGVEDLVGLPDAEHAPSGAGGGVDLVDLESDDGVA